MPSHHKLSKTAVTGTLYFRPHKTQWLSIFSLFSNFDVSLLYAVVAFVFLVPVIESKSCVLGLLFFNNF